jgi:HlyD family secretion protein
MSTEIFRKSALQALSSLEQLDQLIKVTRARSWIALAAMASVLLVAIVWSVVGSLPTSVTGQGVLIRAGGTFNIVSPGAGLVTQFRDFRIGEEVEKGEILGHISQPALEQQMAAAKAEVERLRVAEAAVRSAISQESRTQRPAYKLQEEQQRQVIHAKQDLLRSLQISQTQQSELLRDGLITRQRYETTRQAIFAAENEISAANAALQRLLVQQAETESQQAERTRGEGAKLAQALSRLHELQLQYRLAHNIVSEIEGVVVEVMVMNGDSVKEGQPVLSVEVPQQTLQSMVYLPADSRAKLIQPGMLVQISPVTSKKERYGYLVGKVTTVSNYPATESGMNAVLSNPSLVRELSKSGPPISVLVELVPDHATRSGYAWSSHKGAQIELHSGTLCSASFVIERRRPISLVIPLLIETLGL